MLYAHVVVAAQTCSLAFEGSELKVVSRNNKSSHVACHLPSPSLLSVNDEQT